jgi:hypothetical protein
MARQRSKIGLLVAVALSCLFQGHAFAQAPNVAFVATDITECTGNVLITPASYSVAVAPTPGTVGTMQATVTSGCLSTDWTTSVYVKLEAWTVDGLNFRGSSSDTCSVGPCSTTLGFSGGPRQFWAYAMITWTLPVAGGAWLVAPPTTGGGIGCWSAADGSLVSPLDPARSVTCGMEQLVVM